MRLVDLNGKWQMRQAGVGQWQEAVVPGSVYGDLLRNGRIADLNCIRVWGGGCYPSDDFYDCCDRYGLIVWQDLMFACCIYPTDGRFIENVSAEVSDNMRRLRYHACLGMFCGNNELEWFWADRWQNDVDTSYRRGYLEMFEHILPDIATREATDTLLMAAVPQGMEIAIPLFYPDG